MLDMKHLSVACLIAAAWIARFCIAMPQCGRQLAVREQPADACISKSPPPSKTVCGQAGQLNLPPKGSSSAATQILDFETCLYWCFHKWSCKFFSLNSESGLCSLYTASTPREYSYQANSSSTNVFYQMSCFNCSKECPMTPGLNVIDNAGFDMSTKYYGPWTSLYPRSVQVVSPGHNSENAISFPKDLTNFRRLCRGQRYLLELDIKVIQLLSNPPGFAYFEFDIRLGDGITVGRFELNDTWFGGWHKVIFSSESPGNDRVAITFLPQASTKKPVFQAFLDSVVVRPMPTNPKKVGSSLLLNGGFEAGNHKPWAVTAIGHDNMFDIISPGLPGQGGKPRSKFAFRFKGEGRYDQHYEAAFGSFTIQQNTTKPTEAGKLYILTFQYQAFRSNRIDVSINNNDFWWIADDDRDDNYPQVLPKLKLFSRVFTGSGKIDVVRIHFGSAEPYQQMTMQKTCRNKLKGKQTDNPWDNNKQLLVDVEVVSLSIIALEQAEASEQGEAWERDQKYWKSLALV